MSGFIDRAEVDLIVNGVGRGEVAQGITGGQFTVEDQVGFDPGILRPIIQNDGNKYCLIKTGRMVANKPGDPGYTVNKKNGDQVPESKYIPLRTLINNGTVPHTTVNSALPYLTWQRIDKAVIRASRNRLQAWNDLAAANTFGGFDGMSITGLIRDTMTDPGSAKVDMDTLSDDFSDGPLFTPDILPLPIIHSGATISQRRLAQSRNSGMPLDTGGIEAAGRRVSETLEKMTIGIDDFSSLVIGNDTTFTNNGIYGFLTHPDNMGSIPTAPASFVPKTLLSDVLAMVELARAQNFYGPFVLYYGTAWDQHMSKDYFMAGSDNTGLTSPNQTMLQRLNQIRAISRIQMLDNLTGSTYNDRLILVQMTSETVRAVVGMEFTTVQWTKDGGAQTNLRVLGIKVPDLRSQYVGTSTTVSDRICAIVDGNPA